MDQKTIEQIIYETEQALVDIVEQSNLNPAILELILRGIYNQVNAIAHQNMMAPQMIVTSEKKMSMDEDGNIREENDNSSQHI